MRVIVTKIEEGSKTQSDVGSTRVGHPELVSSGGLTVAEAPD